MYIQEVEHLEVQICVEKTPYKLVAKLVGLEACSVVGLDDYVTACGQPMATTIILLGVVGMPRIEIG